MHCQKLRFKCYFFFVFIEISHEQINHFNNPPTIENFPHVVCVGIVRAWSIRGLWKRRRLSWIRIGIGNIWVVIVGIFEWRAIRVIYVEVISCTTLLIHTFDWTSTVGGALDRICTLHVKRPSAVSTPFTCLN